MHFRKDGNVYCLRLQKGQEIVESLTQFLKEEYIRAGFITGIGATDDVTIGYYDASHRTYVKEDLKEAFEILGLNGNITIVDDAPFTHLHIMLGNEEFKVMGGHLFRAVVSLTAEIFITAVDMNIERKFDSETGLKTMNI
ncbi:MAG: DNA-binding protein [Firmicutes bacterium]|nr:DNA-binding protein [Bacillota bacterium]